MAVDRSGEPRYRAADGESNTVTVTVAASSMADRFDVTVTDSTAPILAGHGCQQASGDTVTCPQVDRAEVNVDLGDGDDSAQVGLAGRASHASVRGRDGNDRLTIAEGYSRLSGGPGNDVLTAGPFGDSLYGGGGRDELHAGGGRYDYVTDGDREGAVDADVLDGGGQGCLGYSSRTRPLRVDLSKRGPDGQLGEGDHVSGFAQVAAGSGDDVLIGTRADERFSGGGGADRIYARGGNDRVVAFGRELVVGGPGTDRVDYFSFGLCGGSPSRSDGPGSWLSRSCELLVLSAPSKCGAMPRVRPLPVAVSRSGRLRFRMRFDSSGVEPPPCGGSSVCHARLTLSEGSAPVRRLAVTRFRMRLNGDSVSIQLPSGVARRARHRPVRVRARLAWQDDCGGRYAAAWRFDLKIAGRSRQAAS